MKLGLREANQRFSRAIKAVRRGRTVVLTERGRPIAVVKPVGREPSAQAALEAMADAGLITLPSRPGPMPALGWRPVAVTGTPMSQTIIDDREDRA